MSQSVIDPNAKRDNSHKPVPINPPQHSSKELWYAMNFQCSYIAGFISNGVPEFQLVDENDGKHPSEVERMKKAVGEKPKQ
jgi:hypothetical protein